MMPPSHCHGPQFASMFPYKHFLGLGEQACNSVERISAEVRKNQQEDSQEDIDLYLNSQSRFYS